VQNNKKKMDKKRMKVEIRNSQIGQTFAAQQCAQFDARAPQHFV
jgi:hypothetical protein